VFARVENASFTLRFFLICRRPRASFYIGSALNLFFFIVFFPKFNVLAIA
jgi:hypothetical protein